jgi:DNA-binding transcriptional LysR family regulator
VTNPVTLVQLEYFLSAVRHGSLSAAAEAHFVAQPSVSEQIRRLEHHLGVQLFVRTNRRLILTEAGRTLLPYAERAIAAAQDAAAAVDPVRTLRGGTVAFGTFSSAHHLVHAELAARFHALHPQVRLRLVGMNSVQVADSVRAGDLEAGLVALPVDDRGLDVGPVVWSTEAVYLSADPERVRTPRTIEQLAAADLVLPEARWGDMDPTRHQLVMLAQNAGVALRPIIEVESPAVALELARRGVGDTVISSALAAVLGATPALGSASLVPPVHETFAFVIRRGALPSPAMRVLLDLAEQLLGELPQPEGARSPAPRRRARPQGRTR